MSLVVGASAAVAYASERDHLLELMDQAAATQARLTLTGLQFAMLENNRTLLHELIAQYARSAEVEHVFITDATGTVAVTSVPGWAGHALSLPLGVCPTCELLPGEPQAQTSVISDGKRSVLRSLTVVQNEAQCTRCHPAVQKTLGVLGVDFSMAPIERARTAIIRRTFSWGVAVVLLVLLVEGAVVQLGALGRLRRLRDAARALLPEKEGARAGPLRGDEIGELAAGLREVSSALHDTQAQVDRQKSFLVEVIDQVEEGVAVFDRSLTVVAANLSYLQRIGASRDQVARGELRCETQILCGEIGCAEECSTRLSFRHGRLEKRIHRQMVKDKEVFFEVFASPILDANGETQRVVEMWRDVTERVGLQATLARSEQLAVVGTLASGFSHEISTPLGTVSTSIQGMLRVLSDRERLEGPEVAALKSRLEVASREIFRCRDITRSLLDLGRKRRTVRDQVQAGALVTRMLDVVRPTAERQQITIVNRTVPGLGAVFGHADQLEQVLLNLFINAIEAMPGSGALEVEARASSGGVEVVVADTGPGVALADAARIFDPFYSRKTGGSGLGLYVSRQIIEAHGGRIELDPANGRGAVFRVFLPAAPAPSP